MSVDGHSGIGGYQIAIGTSAGGTQIAPWTSNGTATSKQFCSLSLNNGTTYHVSVRASDNLANISNETRSSWRVDTGVPSTPASIDDATSGSSMTQSPTITWAASTDAVSGISHYEVAIGTTAGGTQKANWTNVGDVTSTVISGLDLSTATYYASVRAVDRAGNVSGVRQGNGWANAPAIVLDCSVPGSRTFNYSGAQVAVLAGTGCSSFSVKAWGGGGGGGTGGSYAGGALSVTPGDTLTISVGGAGSYSGYVCPWADGGWPNGNGVYDEDCWGPGGSGGGSSSVYRSGTRLIEAAGGYGGDNGAPGGGTNTVPAGGTITTTSTAAAGNGAAAPCNGNCGSADVDGLIQFQW